MNIPLPKTVSDVGPGGIFVTNARGVNALNNETYKAHINAVKAQYAPLTERAQAASQLAYANLLPYQIQAQVMSNPMLWYAYKDHPEVLQNMVDKMMKSVPSPENVFGNVQFPPVSQPPAGIGGLVNNLVGMLHRQPPAPVSQSPVRGFNPPQMPPQSPGMQPPQDNNTATEGQARYIAEYGNSDLKPGQPIPELTPDGKIINPSPESSPSLSPASKGGFQGLIASNTAKGSQQPYTPGLVATIDGKDISVPAGSTVGDVQKAYIGIKNSMPILNDIAKGAEEFLKPGVKGQMLMTQIDNLVQQWGGINLIPKSVKNKIGLDNAKLSRYAKWLSRIQQAPESLMKAFDLPQNELALKKASSIIEPVAGESAEGYRNRVMDEISQLTGTRIPLYQTILHHGVPLDSEKTKTNIKPLKNPVSKGAKLLSRDIKFPSFNSAKEFQDWYAIQDKMVQDAIRIKLENEKQNKNNIKIKMKEY